MSEESKKISFGFSKLKKTNLLKPVALEKKEVEYVDSFDGKKGKFSFKGAVRFSGVKKPLVIPLVGSRTAFDVIKAKLEEKEQQNCDNDQKIIDNGVATDSKIVESKVTGNVPVANPQSIDELAAKEIINDLNQNVNKDEALSTMVISQEEATGPNLKGEKESTLEDYENVPVNDFGLAMLRGMGWKPETGIGKNHKVVPTVDLKVRPKGLGLGADKVLAKQPSQEEDLVIGPKAFVKFLSGPNNGKYGLVEAVDGDTGRVVVKLALGGMVSVSELLLVAVTRKDYEKNCKVLNVVKYEQYKDTEVGRVQDQTISSSHKSDADPNTRKFEKIKKNSNSDNTHRKEKFDKEKGRRRSKSPKGSRHRKSSKKHERSKERSKKDYSDSSSQSDSEKEKKKKKNKKDKSRSQSRDRRCKKKKIKYSSESEAELDRDDKRRRSNRYGYGSDSDSDAYSRHKSKNRHR